MHVRKTKVGWIPTLSESEHLTLDHAKELADQIAQACKVPNGEPVDNDLRLGALVMRDNIAQFQLALVLATRKALGDNANQGTGRFSQEPAELETAED